MSKNPMLDTVFINATKWQPVAQTLRKILLEAGLSEELKWGKPCQGPSHNNLRNSTADSSRPAALLVG